MFDPEKVPILLEKIRGKLLISIHDMCHKIGIVFYTYKRLMNKEKVQPKTQRRVTDFIRKNSRSILWN